jgi:replicative DNA helicase
MATRTTKDTKQPSHPINVKEIVDSVQFIPPRDLAAERAILGAIMIDKEALFKVIDIITPESFYDGRNQTVYRAMLSLYAEHIPSDLVTLSDKLTQMSELEKIGGAGYITDLLNDIPVSANIAHHANIIQGHFLRRELVSLSNTITEKSLDVQNKIEDVMDQVSASIFSLAGNRSGSGMSSLHQTLAENFDRLEEMHRNKGKLRGIPTGFRDIDGKLAGLQDNNLIILAARPSVGKTSLALNICQYVAVHEKVPILFFSLESSKEELVDRLLASQANVDSWKIATGNLTDKDWESLTDAMGELADSPLFIDDSPGMSIMEMRAKARRAQIEHGIRLVVVDYLQLARGSEKYRGENRVQEVSEISQGLKGIAKELKCPLIALSQLSRNIEQRGTADKPSPPQLSDLRDSGSIEQDADVVMFLWREDNTLAGRSATDTIPVKLSIAKHRNGPIGEVDLIFKGARTRYYGVDKKAQE